MFALTPKPEFAVRVILITAILFNAVVPVAAAPAMIQESDVYSAEEQALRVDEPLEQPAFEPVTVPREYPVPETNNIPNAAPLQQAGFPTTSILDDFNRANGGIGSNWSGSTSGYSISSNKLSVGSGGNIYWGNTLFGSEQEVYVTFTQVGTSAVEQDLLLKSQSSTSWTGGVIEVLYDAPAEKVQVWTYHTSQNWVQHGADIPVTFANGDQFGARARADGIVEVYKNGVLLATRDVSSWTYAAEGGYIGLWFIDATEAVLDDFGGGTVSGGEGLMSMPSSSGESAFSVESMSLEGSQSLETASDPYNQTLSHVDTFWQGIPLGSNQEAVVTFAQIGKSANKQKPQSNGIAGDGTVQVLYDVLNQRIQVWTYGAQKGWVQYGKDIPVTFVEGDVFSARVGIDGEVAIYQNGKLLAKRTLAYQSLQFVSYRFQGEETSTPTATATNTPTPTGTPFECNDWNATEDYRPAPDQENPNRDSCNNLGVWKFMGSASTVHDPQTYYLLPNFNPNGGGVAGQNYWTGTHVDGNGQFPIVAFNNTGTAQGSWQPDTFLLHPAPNQLAIIAWESKYNGFISISGGVSDPFAGFTNGIGWQVQKNSTTLASGYIGDTASQLFVDGTGGSSLNVLQVSVGDILYFSIDPVNNHYYGDSTIIDIRISGVSVPNTATPQPTTTGIPSKTPTPSRTPSVSLTPAVTSTPGGGTTQTTINYVYDPLNRLTSAIYDDGRSFGYEYDAVGNVLQYTQNLGGSTVVTTYGYNNANQLSTAQTDNSLTIWQYAYDPLGRLTDVLPDGVPTIGSSRYTYNTASYLVKTETHNGSNYQLQAEMLYDGLGQRLKMTGYALGSSVTTDYVLDPLQNAHPLTATSLGNTTTYFYGVDPIAELTTGWSYSLPDGTGTPRQLTDGTGDITLSGRYTPWGDSLEYAGAGNFTFGYFGGMMDAATGLFYVGNGQYYDPATGRFLTRYSQPGSTNPYVPWGNPVGAVLAPVALIGLLYGRKRKKSSLDYFVIVLFIMLGTGLGLSACAPGNPPTPTTIPSLPPPIVRIETMTPNPTSTPDPSKCNSGYGCTAYLTFDDGPDPLDYTTDIAFTLLAQHNAKATFFITAVDNVENGLERFRWVCQDQQGLTPNWRGQNAMQLLVNSGHAIGLHGLYHEAFGYQGDQGLYLLTAEEEKFREVGIVLSEPVMARSPELGWGIVPIPGFKSARYYDADIISDDDKGLSSDGIVKSVTNQLRNHNLPDNPIILLHSTKQTTYQTIVFPLPNADLMKELKDLGYSRFEALPRPNDPINTIIGRHATGW